MTSRPFLTETRAVVPSMRHLAPAGARRGPRLRQALPGARTAGPALDAKPVPGTPNAGELILALKSAPAAVDFTSGSDRAGRVRRAQPVRAGHLPGARRDRRERQRALAVRRGHVRPGVVPVRGAAQAVRAVQPARPARGRGSRRGAGVRLRRARRRDASCSRRRSGSRRRSTTRRRGSRQEVATRRPTAARRPSRSTPRTSSTRASAP